MLINLSLGGLTACTTSQPVETNLARSAVADAWQSNQHIVWELDRPGAPVGGPLTVEIWRNGNQYRYEILEAVAPALIGESLVFNGHIAWQYNRFDSTPPVVLDSPRLSPVSDTWAVIERLIATPPQIATQEPVQIMHGPAQKITLVYTNGNRLILWRDDETQLPVKVVFSAKGQKGTLNARDFEPLIDPLPGLFNLH